MAPPNSYHGTMLDVFCSFGPNDNYFVIPCFQHLLYSGNTKARCVKLDTTNPQLRQNSAAILIYVLFASFLRCSKFIGCNTVVMSNRGCTIGVRVVCIFFQSYCII